MRFLHLNKGRGKKGPFCSLLLQRGPDPPPLVVPWESEIFLVNIFVVVDAIGLETDFTLETNRKRMKEKLLKSTLRLRKRAFFGPLRLLLKLS